MLFPRGNESLRPGSDWPMCHWHRGPWPAHPWTANKPLFNSGFVKLVKRKMAFFRTFKWLIWNKLFRYWTLNVKNSTPRNIAYVSLISWIRDGKNLFWPPKLAFYAVQNESLISFGPKYFFKMVWYTVRKCYLRPLYFAQKCPQNAGNAVSETQKFKKVARGSCLRTPYGNMLSLYREDPWDPSRLKWQGP